MSSASTVPAAHDIHPFLRGNFAPVTEEYISYSCDVVHGEIPNELLGGQYIRNGGNPVYPPEKGRHYHWFDGDGMLHGVLFPTKTGSTPLYTNRHLATPLLTLTLVLLRSPIPSIALLISPLSSLHRIVTAVIQAFTILVRARMGVLSVANTSVLWWGQGLGTEAEEEYAVEAIIPSAGRPGIQRTESRFRDYRKDQRLLATCESGPPLEVRVPELETVGWDKLVEAGTGESLENRRGKWAWWKRWSLSRVQEDWMTAHPRVDPVDGSLIFYSSSMFETPHAKVSVIDRKGNHLVWKEGVDVGRAKMMHDFAATRTHTILLNLPLTLAPTNLFSLPPVPLIYFDRTLPSEFIVFPRLLRHPSTPNEPVHFIDTEPSLIFHTANAWDEYESGKIVAVNMLGCRFKSAQLVYAAGAVDVPKVEKSMASDDVVRLHYYRFAFPADYSTNPNSTVGSISHSFPLTAIPFEFPTMSTEHGMSAARYVYGCTMESGTFDERLGGAAKVDCLAKIDVQELVERGRERGHGKNMEPVDARKTTEIMSDWEDGKAGPIEIFHLPPGWYAQEPRFVPRAGCDLSEDDGFLLTYVYDERYLLSDGSPSTDVGAGSELWIVDAKIMHRGMAALVCRIKLPQRVPYGLHGTYLAPKLIRQQRPISEIPDQPLLQDKLVLSRLRRVASVVFSRPSSREKSRFERAVLTVLWPAAVGMLALACGEVFRHLLSGDLTRQDVGSTQNYVRNSTFSDIEGSDATYHSIWPQIMSGLLVIVVAVYRAYPLSGKGESVASTPLQEI